MRDAEKKYFVGGIIYVALFICMVAVTAAACIGAVHYERRYKQLAVRFEQAQRESANWNRLCEEYEGRLSDVADILTGVADTSGDLEALLRESVDTLDRITGVLFPVRTTKQSTEDSPGDNDTSIGIDSSYLYNRSISKIGTE
jgi:hypothetical protein